MRRIKILDTTLRDGEQAPGCSMGRTEKLEIALALERMGVDIIEAGFPVSSKADFEAVRMISGAVKGSAIAALARAVKKDVYSAYEAIKDAARPRIHVFIATSPIHMEHKLKKSPADILQAVRETVAYAKSLTDDVQFSAEDATRSETAFLIQVFQTAIECGASTVGIADTVGYITPDETASLVRKIAAGVKNIEKAQLAIHCHDDLGMAVANSLAAIGAGCSQVDCTINGIGERAGNAALEEIAMALYTRGQDIGAEHGIDTSRLFPVSRLVYNVLGMTPPLNKAVVGKNAFAHESGIHQHGVLANRLTYEIMTPESVGVVNNRMILGKHSGRHAVESRLAELGYKLEKEDLDALFERFKSLSEKKTRITDRDLTALLAHRKIGGEAGGGYRLSRFTINSGNYVASNAVIRLTRGRESFEEVCLGDGPVDAAFNAVDRIIGTKTEHSLDDYAIHTVSEGKDAQGEAIVRIKCGGMTFIGRGLSTDVIEASILAYVNGMNKLVAWEAEGGAEGGGDGWEDQ